MKRRWGHTLAEVLVVLPLAALLGALLVGTLVAQVRLARSITDRLERAETERLAFAVLRHELRWTAAADVAAADTDSITLRMLRGVALVCSAGPGGSVVAYRGWREPNPAKDSLLIVAARGERSAALQSSAPAAAGCGDDGRSLRASVELASGVLLLFERGTYHLAGRALRFRAGAEGRQPLTGEWLDDAGTGFAYRSGRSAPDGLALRLLGQPARQFGWLLPNQSVP